MTNAEAAARVFGDLHPAELLLVRLALESGANLRTVYGEAFDERLNAYVRTLVGEALRAKEVSEDVFADRLLNLVAIRAAEILGVPR